MYLYEIVCSLADWLIHSQSNNLGDDNHSKNEETKGARYEKHFLKLIAFFHDYLLLFFLVNFSLDSLY